MKNKVKKYSVLMALILMIVLIYGKNLGKVDLAIENTHGKEITKAIAFDTVVRQGFVVEQNRLCGLAVQFGTYSRENLGYLQLTLYDSRGNKVVTNRISRKNLQDNGYYEWFFDPILFSRGEEYTLEIKGDDQESAIDNSVVLYKSSDVYSPMTTLIIDNQIEAGAINLKAYYIHL